MQMPSPAWTATVATRAAVLAAFRMGRRPASPAASPIKDHDESATFPQLTNDGPSKDDVDVDLVDVAAEKEADDDVDQLIASVKLEDNADTIDDLDDDLDGKW
jgi:hypothetical protein